MCAPAAAAIFRRIPHRHALIEKGALREKMRSRGGKHFPDYPRAGRSVRVSAIALVISVVLGTSAKLRWCFVIALTILKTRKANEGRFWTDVEQLLLYLTRQRRDAPFCPLNRHSRRMERSRASSCRFAGHKIASLDFSSLSTNTRFGRLIGGEFLTMAATRTTTPRSDDCATLARARSERDSRRRF